MKRKIAGKLYWRIFQTSHGPFYMEMTEQGLYRMDFGARVGSNRRRVEASRRFPLKVRDQIRKAEAAIRAYLTGEREDFKELPIDWSGVAGFKRRVLESLRKVPFGKPESYQFLAKKAGRPRAARYVGRILHENRLPLVLPCHRIVAKSGDLGGFSKGLKWKRRLLKLEGVSVDKS